MLFIFCFLFVVALTYFTHGWFLVSLPLAMIGLTYLYVKEMIDVRRPYIRPAADRIPEIDLRLDDSIEHGFETPDEPF